MKMFSATQNICFNTALSYLNRCSRWRKLWFCLEFRSRSPPPPLSPLSLVLCHCDVAHSCVANGVESRQVTSGATNRLIGSHWQPTAGGPANWKLGMAYKIAHWKKYRYTKRYTEPHYWKWRDFVNTVMNPQFRGLLDGLTDCKLLQKDAATLTLYGSSIFAIIPKSVYLVPAECQNSSFVQSDRRFGRWSSSYSLRRDCKTLQLTYTLNKNVKLTHYKPGETLRAPGVWGYQNLWTIGTRRW